MDAPHVLLQLGSGACADENARHALLTQDPRQCHLCQRLTALGSHSVQLPNVVKQLGREVGMF